jgi:hypothetical protein
MISPCTTVYLLNSMLHRDVDCGNLVDKKDKGQSEDVLYESLIERF